MQILGKAPLERCTSSRLFGALMLAASLTLPSGFVLGQSVSKNTDTGSSQKGDPGLETLKERNRLWRLANEYFRQGNLIEARKAVLETLAIERKLLGSFHEDVISSLQLLSKIDEAGNDFSAAQQDLQEILAIRKQTTLVKQAWKVKDAELALLDLDQRRTLDVTTRRELQTAFADIQQAVECYHRGDYAQGLTHAKRALPVYQKILGAQHHQTALVLNKVGELLKGLGDYTAARLHFEQALAINTTVYGRRSPGVAVPLSNLGTLLTSQGDYAGARPHLEEALSVLSDTLGEQHRDSAIALGNLGVLLYSQGDYDGARPYYEQALTILKKVLGEDHPYTGYLLNNLGLLLMRQGDLIKARDCLERSLAIAEGAEGRGAPNIGIHALTLDNLGTLLSLQEDHQGAQRYRERALELLKKALGEEHPETITALSNLGDLLCAQGSFDKGWPLREKALALRTKLLGEQHPLTLQSVDMMASVFEQQGELEKAGVYLERTVRTTLRNLDLAAAAQSERQQLVMTRALRFYLDHYLAWAVRSHVPPEKLYEQVLAWKGIVLARQRHLRLQRDEVTLAPLVNELHAVAVRLARAAFATPDPKGLDEHRELIVKLTRQKEDLESQLSQKSKLFRAAQEQTRLTPAQLQKALPPHAVLVDFLEYRHGQPDPEHKGKWLFERRFLAFVIRANQPVRLIQLGQAGAIEELIAQWQLLLHRKAEQAAAEALRQRLWEPLEKEIATAKLVLVGADGALARLPLGALPGKNKGTYLIEEVAIAVVPVPQLLAETYGADRSPSNEERSSLLLVGDVDFEARLGDANRQAKSPTAPQAHSGQQRVPWQELTGTRDEVEALEALFRKSFGPGGLLTLRRADATEETFRVQCSRRRWIHLSTHGFFASPSVRSVLALATPDKKDAFDSFGSLGLAGFHPGLLSGIVLAGANQPAQPGQDDGILTAFEVADLDLRKTELIVLSACETGLGQVAGGEGLLGLQRAFHVAGARTVVASLWNVPDEPTRVLMERFYGNLWSGEMSKLDALMAAQRWMLREGRANPGVLRGIQRLERNSEPLIPGRLPPYYWAAFVLSGDPR